MKTTTPHLARMCYYLLLLFPLYSFAQLSTHVYFMPPGEAQGHFLVFSDWEIGPKDRERGSFFVKQVTGCSVDTIFFTDCPEVHLQKSGATTGRQANTELRLNLFDVTEEVDRYSFSDMEECMPKNIRVIRSCSVANEKDTLIEVAKNGMLGFKAPLYRFRPKADTLTSMQMDFSILLPAEQLRSYGPQSSLSFFSCDIAWGRINILPPYPGPVFKVAYSPYPGTVIRLACGPKSNGQDEVKKEIVSVLGGMMVQTPQEDKGEEDIVERMIQENDIFFQPLVQLDKEDKALLQLNIKKGHNTFVLPGDKQPAFIFPGYFPKILPYAVEYKGGRAWLYYVNDTEAAQEIQVKIEGLTDQDNASKMSREN